MSAAGEPLTERLRTLDQLPLTELRRAWTAATETPPPRVSANLLRLALGHHWQVQAHGGLSAAEERRLLALANDQPVAKQARPGTRLVREWQGRTHVVTIGEDGAVTWNDRSWRSLSEVARAITGTRWSGPAFFGLRPKRAKVTPSVVGASGRRTSAEKSSQRAAS